MTIHLRRAQHADSAGIIQAHIQSIRNVCSKDYNPEQIQAWAGRKFRVDLWNQTIDRDYVWVLVDDCEVLGFGHFAKMSEDAGEVLGLYFVPEVIGKGMGKKLFQFMLEVARENHLKKINLHATITAKSFYQSLGFQQSGSDETVDMQGVAIPCFPMEFLL